MGGEREDTGEEQPLEATGCWMPREQNVKAGKAATVVLMAAVVLIIFDVRIAGEVMFYAGFGLSLLSGVFYVGRVSDLFGRKDAG